MPIFYPPLTSPYNVRAYGALGDLATDDTAAIQATWAALVAAGGGELYFPGGTYLTTGLVFGSGAGFAIRGARNAIVTLARGTLAAPTQATHNVVTIADCTDFVVDGLVVDGRRDTIAGDQFLTSNAASGQKTVVVADGTKFVVGEMVSISGGRTANGGTEKNFTDWFQYITGINGTTLTLTSNLTHAYTATGASGGAYVTRYQTGDATVYAAAGRTLGNEDAQNGIHLLSCQRFSIVNCVAQNVWESPIKLGTGFQPSTVTDGCSYGSIENNLCRNGFDQGVSVWVSNRIAVLGNVCTNAGWAGISFTHSRDCSATGNVCTDNVYSPATDLDEGTGIACEGAERVTVSGNICTNNTNNGIRLTKSPVFLGSTTTSGPIVAGATAFTVAAAGFMATGTSHTIVDAADATLRENFQVLSKVSTTITTVDALRNAYTIGSSVLPRYNLDVTISGNACSKSALGAGINAQEALGLLIAGNDCTNAGNGVDANGCYGIQLSNAAHDAEVVGNTCAFNAKEGIFVDTITGARISENHVVSSGLSGLAVDGIRLFNATDCAVTNNKVEKSARDGIHCEPGLQRNLLSGNVSRSNHGRGIIVYGSPSWGYTITNNVCTLNSEPGIDLRGTRDSMLQANTCANNSQEGIRFDDNAGSFCTKNVVRDNLLYDDRAGIARTQPTGFHEYNTSGSTQVLANRIWGHTSTDTPQIAVSSTATGNITG